MQECNGKHIRCFCFSGEKKQSFVFIIQSAESKAISIRPLSGRIADNRVWGSIPRRGALKSYQDPARGLFAAPLSRAQGCGRRSVGLGDSAARKAALDPRVRRGRGGASRPRGAGRLHSRGRQRAGRGPGGAHGARGARPRGSKAGVAPSSCPSPRPPPGLWLRAVSGGKMLNGPWDICERRASSHDYC